MLADIESDRVERKESLRGEAPEKVRQAICAFANDLPGHGQAGVVFIGARDKDGTLVGLQQLVRNAVMHRTYEETNAPIRLTWFNDRIEILSPGGPYGIVNRKNFGQPGVTDYRNPHLAEAMKVLGYVQRFGVGIPTARRLLAENGNPPLQFDVDANFVMATVRKARP